MKEGRMREATDTKSLIARAALELFVEKGITETTIRDIASRVGVAEGTMYRHYASKDELAWELFITNLEAFARKLDGVQAEHSSTRAKLDAMVREFCRAFDEDWAMFSYLLLTRHRHGERVTAERQNPVEVLRKTIRDGMERGEIPKGEADVATSMVLGLILQVADASAGRAVDKSLSALAYTLSQAAWRVLKGQ